MSLGSGRRVGDATAPRVIAGRERSTVRGGFGATESAVLHVRERDALVTIEVYVAINADTHPELAARWLTAEPHLPALGTAGQWTDLAVPLWFFEPSRELCVLILPPALRYLELSERAAALARLEQLPAGEPVSCRYLAPHFATSVAELAALRAAHPTVRPPRITPARLRVPASPPTAEVLATWQRSLETQHAELIAHEAAARALEELGDDPLSDPALLGLEEIEVELERVAPTTAGPLPRLRDTLDDSVSALQASTAPPATMRELPLVVPDAWLVEVMALGRHALAVEGREPTAVVRVALAAARVADARALSGPLEVRLLLHRMPSYPVLTLVIGSPAGLRGDRRSVAVVCLDPAIDRDRAALLALARSFTICVEVFEPGRLLRRGFLSAPLAENVTYVQRAAREHLRRLAELGSSLSAPRGLEQVLHPDHDLLGQHHPFADELTIPPSPDPASAEKVRAALELVRRLGEPAAEDYLVCTRGWPLTSWRQLRREVMTAAIHWGLALGPELARVAVSEGLARSRRQLVELLLTTFEQRRQGGLDLDGAAIAANRAALERESVGAGVGAVRSAAIASDSDAVVAGSIDLDSSRIPPALETSSIAELVSALADPATRAAACLELCRRRAKETAVMLVEHLPEQSRERVAELAARIVSLERAVEPPLLAQLASPLPHLRQLAALMLSAVGGDDATAALVELLLVEPTELWREVARALGQLGPSALPHLAQAVAQRGASPRAEERTAWAMAQLGAHAGTRAITQIASGHSIMAPIAAKALALVEPATRDLRALLATPSKDEVRELSRRFFLERRAIEQAAVPTEMPSIG